MADIKSFHEQVKRGDLNGVRASIAEDASLLEATNDIAALLEELGAKLQ